MQNTLRRASPRGNFTREENLHLTLAFLGETPEGDIPAISRAIAAISIPAFDVFFSRFGCFKQGQRELWWIGVEEGSLGMRLLEQMQSRLAHGLRNGGISFDERPFNPHITLARELRVSGKVELAEGVLTRVSRISLMQSQRIGGVLTYTERFGQDCNDPP